MKALHPNVVKYIHDFEEEARRNGSYRYKLGKFQVLFLQNIYGPAFDYRFDGLKAEFPFKDFKDGDRFVDFTYVKGSIRIAIEIDGFSTHARDISPEDFDDHLTRQNDLVLSGWIILRFSNRMVEKSPMLCRATLTQALGHWWTLNNSTFSPEEKDLWIQRKKIISLLAIKQGGIVKSNDVVNEFKVSRRTAVNWLQRFAEEDFLEPITVNQRITSYRLKGYEIERQPSVGRYKRR